jgi:hypothetical protein
MAYANATAPDFGSSNGVDEPPIDVDEILLNMMWPEVPIRQMETTSQWWEQVPQDNVTIRVVPRHSDAVEHMFPELCAQNRQRLQQHQEDNKKGSSGGFFGKKKKETKQAPQITTNAMDIIVEISKPEGVNDLIFAMNSAAFPGPAVLTFKIEGNRNYEPTRDADSWKLLAAVFRKCYPQFMTMEKLEITGQNIGDEALVFIASAVIHYPRLIDVDLFENKISGKGAVNFFKLVTKNKNIKIVNLGKNVLDMNNKEELNKLASDADVDCDTF